MHARRNIGAKTATWTSLQRSEAREELENRSRGEPQTAEGGNVVEERAPLGPAPPCLRTLYRCSSVFIGGSPLRNPSHNRGEPPRHACALSRMRGSCAPKEQPPMNTDEEEVLTASCGAIGRFDTPRGVC